MQINKNVKKALISWILPLAFIVTWDVMAKNIASPAILPRVSDVAENFIHAFDNFIGLGSIPKNIGYSLVRVLLGYFIGIMFALP
ncbi:MAG: ABC transporter permease, partial [Clostridium sp.]